MAFSLENLAILLNLVSAAEFVKWKRDKVAGKVLATQSNFTTLFK